MALWCYDPSSDYCCTGRPCSLRDCWRCCQPDPTIRWADNSPFNYLLSQGFVPCTPTVGSVLREVKCDKEKYQVTLDLGNFKSNEIYVKLVDQALVVCACAEHDGKPDESGHIFRRLKRRYFLPPNVDFDSFKATLSDDGTLVICTKWKAIKAGNEREIEVKKVSLQESEKTEQVTAGTGKFPEKCEGKCTE